MTDEAYLAAKANFNSNVSAVAWTIAKVQAARTGRDPFAIYDELVTRWQTKEYQT